MTDTFTPPMGVDFNAELVGASRVNVTTFADGYQQRSPEGLHPISRNFQVSFIGSKANIKTIWDWLYGKKGVEAFYWTIPDESSQTLFVCGVETMRKRYVNHNTRSFTALFREDFNPT